MFLRSLFQTINLFFFGFYEDIPQLLSNLLCLPLGKGPPGITCWEAGDEVQARSLRNNSPTTQSNPPTHVMQTELTTDE